MISNVDFGKFKNETFSFMLMFDFNTVFGGNFDIFSGVRCSGYTI